MNKKQTRIFGIGGWRKGGKGVGVYKKAEREMVGGLETDTKWAKDFHVVLTA